MKDPQLEKELRLLTLQAESWKRLHDFITYALDKAKPAISIDQERHFTELRSILLQESEHVFAECDLAEQLSGKTLNVLYRATSVRGVRALSPEETRRLEMDWNGVFTKIGVVQGQLKVRRKELHSRSALVESLSQILGRRKALR